MRTLALRMDRASANAAELATRLHEHPAVTRVRYPGSGAMISFEVAGGAVAADAVCAGVRLITHATSLGGVESLIERRAMHAGDAAFGTPENLLRFSVGIEHVADLWADLDQALTAAG
jgi:cystathionine gamma-synthase